MLHDQGTHTLSGNPHAHPWVILTSVSGLMAAHFGNENVYGSNSKHLNELSPTIGSEQTGQTYPAQTQKSQTHCYHECEHPSIPPVQRECSQYWCSCIGNGRDRYSVRYYGVSVVSLQAMIMMLDMRISLEYKTTVSQLYKNPIIISNQEHLEKDTSPWCRRLIWSWDRP